MKRILPALVLGAFATLALAQKPATIPDTQFGLKKGEISPVVKTPHVWEPPALIWVKKRSDGSFACP